MVSNQDSQRKEIVLLGLAALGYSTSYALVMTYLPVYFSLAISAAVIGIAFSLSDVAEIAMRLPSGIVSDLFGVRNAAQIGFFVTAMAGLLLLGLNPSYSIYVVMVLYGVAIALVSTSMTALTLTIGRRGSKAYGTYQSIMRVGHVIGPLAGGLLIAGQGYNGVFILAALLPFLSIGLTSRSVAGRVAEPANHRPSGFKLKLPGFTFSRPLLVVSLVLMLAQFWGSFWTVALPLYFIEFNGYGVVTYGVVIALASVLSIASPVIAEFSVARFRIKRTVAASLITTTLLSGMFALAGSDLVLGALIVGSQASYLVAYTSGSIFVSHIAKQEQMGSAVGLVRTISAIGQIFGAIVAGVTYSFATVLLPLVSASVLVAALPFTPFLNQAVENSQ